MRRRPPLGPCLAAALALTGGIAAAPARSAVEGCDIALSLSFDVSASMNEAEFRRMREGTAAALLDPSVVESFEGGVVFVQITEWAERQTVLLDWTRVTGRADLERVAALLAQAPRSPVGANTGLGNAMLFAAGQFERGPACDRLVLDLAGDGEVNVGPHPVEVQSALDAAMQINALATTPAAADFYQSHVIQGAGAFVTRTDGYENFTEAMKSKLNLELFLSDAGRTRPA